MKKRIWVVILAVIIISCEEVFYVDDISKEVVALISPSDNAKFDMQNINLNWAKVEEADEYHLQIATPSFVSANQIVKDTTVTITQFNLDLIPNKYQWRVKALNSQYETAYQTNSFEIVTLNPEELIELLSPVDNLITNVSEQNLKWQAVDYTDKYIIEIWSPDTSGSLVQELESDTNELLLAFEEGQFIWQVKATNEYTSTDFTSRSILVDITAPNIPQLTAPENELLTVNKTVDFKWTRKAVAGSTETDSLFIYKNEALSDLELKEQVTNFEKLATFEVGTYFWFVQSYDESGNTSDKSETFSFTVLEGIELETIELLTPEDNLITNTPNQLFSWEAIEYAKTYNLKIELKESATSVFDVSTEEIEKELNLQDGSYLWKVKALNDFEETAYSERSILVDTQKPNTPELIKPENQSIQTSTITHFEFDRVVLDGSEEMDSLFIYTNNDLTDLVLKLKVVEQNQHEDLTQGTYYWFVQSYDEAGNQSERSEVFTFSIIESIINKNVKLLSPENNLITNGQRIEFSWEALENATSYEFVIKNSVTEEEVLNTTTEQTSIEDVLEDGSYSWKVKAKNAIEETAYSERSIVIDTKAPNTPKLISPENEYRQDETIVHFEITRELINGSQEVDSLFVFSNETLNNEILNKKIDNFNTYQEFEVGTYYWYVQSFDEAGNKSAKSEVHHFTINEAFKNKQVVLTTPQDHLVTNQSIQTFQWETLNEATTYHIQLVDVDSENVISNNTLPITSKTLTLEDGKYYWKVRATDNTEYTEFSSRIIQIDTEGPTKAVLRSPADGSTASNTTVEFTWQLETNNGSEETSTLKVYTDAGLTNEYKTEETTTSSVFMDVVPGTYYWVVEIADKAGNESEQSDVFTFTVE